MLGIFLKMKENLRRREKNLIENFHAMATSKTSISYNMLQMTTHAFDILMEFRIFKLRYVLSSDWFRRHGNGTYDISIENPLLCFLQPDRRTFICICIEKNHRDLTNIPGKDDN